MRILRLDLTRVGHFDGRTLDLAAPASPGALTIVFGENEAGKTTVLQAIRRLLFGFEHREPLAHDGDGKALRVGALLELASGGAPLEVSRRKGRGDTLRGRALAGGDDFDEAWLLACLGNPNQKVFESVFAFSLEDLARGADALSNDHVRGVIYGAALGSARSPQKVLKALRDEQASLFGQGAAKRPINEALQRITEAEQEAAQQSVRSDRLDALEASVTQKKRDADARHARRGEISEELAHLRALAQGVEPWRELGDRREELAALGDVMTLPPGGAEACRAAVDKQTGRVEERARLAARRAEIDASLPAAIPDERLLPLVSSLDALHLEVASYRKARVELPLRERDLADLLRDTTASLAEVRPGWTLESLRAAPLDEAARADLEAAALRREEIDVATRHQEGELARHEARAEELAAKVAGLRPPDDTSAIRAWLDGYSGFAAETKLLREESQRAASLDREARALRLRLSPPLAPPRAGERDPAELPVPPVEEVARFEAELAGIDRKLVTVEEQIATELAELGRRDEALSILDATGQPPAEGDLTAARERRDEGFRLLLKALGGELDEREARAYDADLPLPRAYAERVAAADRVADRLRAEADAVQRRAHVTTERAHAEARRAALGLRKADLEHARLDTDARYVALFSAAEITPLAPAAMQAWLGVHRELVALGLERARNTERRRDLEERTSAFVARGAELVAVDASTAVAQLKALAERRVEAAKRDDEAETALRAEIARNDAELRETRDRLVRLRADASTWLATWRRVCDRLGLEGDLSVPAARRVVARASELRAQLVLREGPLDDAVRGLRAEVGRFERAVAALPLEEDDRSEDPAVTVASLHARAVAAREARDERASLQRARAEIDAADAALAEAERAASIEIDALQRRAGATGPAELLAAVSASERAAALRADIEERERLLRRLRGPFAYEDYAARLATATLEVLGGEIERAEHALAAVAEEARALDREAAVAERERAAIDGGAEAALALERAASQRATLRGLLERYAVLAVAAEILERSVARFERDHQPALLRAASRLFAAMTGGRYVAVVQRLEGDLFVERPDGAALSPDQLSTGTREQLFLAIRLAYVEHYGRSAEPLPVVLDDVLVNFDTERTVATLRALAEFATRGQVLLFTCHRYLVDLAESRGIAARVVTLEGPRAPR